MKKSLLFWPSVFLFGIYILYGLVITPALEYVAADWVLYNTILFDVLDVLLNLFEVLGTAAAFGFLIHGVYRYTAKGCLPLYPLVAGALVFKYLSSLLSVSILRGSLDLTGDFASLLLSFFIELLECGFAVWMGHLLTGKPAAGAHTAFADPFGASRSQLPFKKLFDRRNCLQMAALWSMLAVLVIRLIAFIINDISLGIPYTLSDLPITLIYWMLLIFIPAFCGYLLSLATMLLAEKKQ